MDNYSDMLMEDLIECDVEETDGTSYTAWTEQALDLFISQLKMVKKHTFASEREMLQVVTNKMSHRNFAFTLDQIENKYNSLKRMYTDKRQNNLSVEPELAKLFGDTPATTSKRQSYEELNSSAVKKTKVTPTEGNNSSKQSQLTEDALLDDPEANKKLWPKKTVVSLLELLEEYRPQLGFEIRTKKLMWEAISWRLKEQDFDISPYQVENKWKSLLRHYRGRQEVLRSRTSLSKGIPNKKAFPELFEDPIVVKDKRPVVSFANDQMLPFDDDDDDDDDEDNDGSDDEEVCSLPEVHIVSDPSPDENERNKLMWTTELTKVFVDLLEEYRPMLGTKLRTKKLMWLEVCRRMKILGYELTYTQAHTKWKNLLRQYRSNIERTPNGERRYLGSPSKLAFPELFEVQKPSMRNISKYFEPPRISFVNDQKLPFDDDDDDDDNDYGGYEDEEEHLQFEEVIQLPEVEVLSDTIDPVEEEDVKPVTQISIDTARVAEDVKPIKNKLNLTAGSSSVDKIAKEISSYHKESLKFKNDLLRFKKMKLEAYKERTAQFSRIGDAFTALVVHLENKEERLDYS